ncbi:NACHT domain-containing protein [Kitasatospora sp. NPDC088346]|uniref:NACHT domain-containing protein n=1 Tax=Kitasatospora sp. NPDC088346 TaxID=3364073 RepID=UPI0038190166
MSMTAIRDECRSRWQDARYQISLQRMPGYDLDDNREQVPKDPKEFLTGEEFSFLEDYKRIIARSLNRLEIFGVTLSRPDFHYPLSTAYISLSVSSSNLEILADSKMGSELRVEEAMGPLRKILIRGDAGSGKTTLLKRVAVGSSASDFSDKMAGWNGLIPFYIPLRHYADRSLPSPNEFFEYAAPILKDSTPPGLSTKLLKSGKAVVLIDGIDEVSNHRRDEVRNWLEQLNVVYEGARFIVTSRQAAIQHDWLKESNFVPLELLPMGLADQASFIHHWHSAMISGSSDAETRLSLANHKQALMEKISQRRELRRIGNNPLLCALICALHWDRDMHLPDDRMKLLEAALDMLLARRDVHRNIVGVEGVEIAVRVQESLLQRIAYWMIRNDLAEVDHAQAIERITKYLPGMTDSLQDPKRVFSHLLIRTGLLRVPAPGRVDFVHRSFQEYLAARQLLDEDDLPFLIKHAHEDNWQDVTVMAAGHARESERNKLIRGLLKRASRDKKNRARLLVLAVDSVGNSPALDPDIRQEARLRAAELVPPSNLVQASALATLGEVVLDQLPGPSGLTPEEATATLRTCILVGTPSSMPIMARFATSATPQIERDLIKAWADFDREAYGRLVLSELPWHSRLEATSQDFRHVGFFRNLESLVVLEAQASYRNLMALKKLRQLAVKGPLSDLTGMSGHASIERLFISGSGFEAAISQLDLPRLESLFVGRSLNIGREAPLEEYPCISLVHSTQGGVSKSLDDGAWKRLSMEISKWPKESRSRLKSLGFDAWLGSSSAVEILTLLPGLKCLSITSVGMPDAGDLNRLLAVVRNKSSIDRVMIHIANIGIGGAMSLKFDLALIPTHPHWDISPQHPFILPDRGNVGDGSIMSCVRVS